jgi:hypothetical protein
VAASQDWKSAPYQVFLATYDTPSWQALSGHELLLLMVIERNLNLIARLVQGLMQGFMQGLGQGLPHVMSEESHYLPIMSL